MKETENEFLNLNLSELKSMLGNMINGEKI